MLVCFLKLSRGTVQGEQNIVVIVFCEIILFDCYLDFIKFYMVFNTGSFIHFINVIFSHI